MQDCLLQDCLLQDTCVAEPCLAAWLQSARPWLPLSRGLQPPCLRAALPALCAARPLRLMPCRPPPPPPPPRVRPQLNKLGTFSMSQLGAGGKSAIGDFMKNMRQQNDNFEEQLLKLVGSCQLARHRIAEKRKTTRPLWPGVCGCCSCWLQLRCTGCLLAGPNRPAAPPPPFVRLQVRTLPKVLKYLPSDKAQDARNYVNSLQYWLGGNDGARAGCGGRAGGADAAVAAGVAAAGWALLPPPLRDGARPLPLLLLVHQP